MLFLEKTELVESRIKEILNESFNFISPNKNIAVETTFGGVGTKCWFIKVFLGDVKEDEVYATKVGDYMEIKNELIWIDFYMIKGCGVKLSCLMKIREEIQKIALS